MPKELNFTVKELTAPPEELKALLKSSVTTAKELTALLKSATESERTQTKVPTKSSVWVMCGKSVTIRRGRPASQPSTPDKRPEIPLGVLIRRS